ncbi:MAG: DUF1553 domain-containing protein [Verrucomicrobia bacterium]|nr:DUF1553 domain-containing protein [Verrucomicrobiota bacterium]
MATRTLILALLCGAAAYLNAASVKPATLDLSRLPPAATGPVEFTRDIHPILAAKCHSCHGIEKQKGGLRLDIRAAALDGGDNGKVFLPGKSAQSRLVHALAGLGEAGIMPPKGTPLTSAEIGLVRAWIDAGASWPEDGKIAVKKSDHWAYQAVRRPALPVISKEVISPKSKKRPASPLPPLITNHSPSHPIDAFVRSRLAKERLQPSPQADLPTLIRRLSLDLTGLPPSPEEVHVFLNDAAPDAYEKLVERLLASPHFGERWGRHWLDLARYADSDGYEKDRARPFAYTYRDWVISAINSDLPFDQFSIQQLAGDLLPNATHAQKVATGFHRQTLTNTEGGTDQEEFRCKAIVDRVSTTAAVWLGVTMGCAECHSHKYDPFTQREFYSLFAFFNNANEKSLPSPTSSEQAAYEKAKKSHDDAAARLRASLDSYMKGGLPAKLDAWLRTASTEGMQWRTNASSPPKGDLTRETVSAALATKPEARTTNQVTTLTRYFREQVDEQGTKLQGAVDEHAKKAPVFPATAAAVLAEEPGVRKTFIHVRGNFMDKGTEVRPATPAVLHTLTPRSAQPDRLDLARWLFAPENPLTARVSVNHIWKNLFGRGLVGTVEDFGKQGDKPTHPELLDWLASAFITPSTISSPSSQLGLGWSRKSLIRLIVTSATYKQASRNRPELQERDPNNLLLARQNRLRLEAETVRDAYLAASGLLNPKIGGPSIRPPLPADIAALGYANSVKWTESPGTEKNRRGLYIFFQRTVPYPMLMTFDAPDSNTSCARRERSNTPLQALTLLNDPVFFECAQALGARMAEVPTADVGERIRHGFERALARPPSAEELGRLLRLYEAQHKLAQANAEGAAKIVGAKKAEPELADKATLVALGRVMLNLDEFFTRD